MKISATILFSLSTLAAASNTPSPTPWQPQQPVLGTSSLHGCYSSNIPFDISVGVQVFNSIGLCEDACTKKSARPYAVAALQGDKCWCGDEYPPKSAMVNTTECAEPCPGFALSACGNLKPQRWTVSNTGVKLKVQDAEEGPVQTESSTSVTDSPTQSSTQSGTAAGATQTSSSTTATTAATTTATTAATTTATTAAGPLPTAGAGRAAVGGAAVAAMGMGVLNFL